MRGHMFGLVMSIYNQLYCRLTANAPRVRADRIAFFGGWDAAFGGQLEKRQPPTRTTPPCLLGVSPPNSALLIVMGAQRI